MPSPDLRPPTLLFAHGAGAGMDHPWMVDVAARLTAHGIDVRRFEFPYMRARREGSRRGPDRMPVLLDAFREQVAACPPGPLALGGKSMGGRIATMLADELQALAVVVFGYPFHPPAKPENLRTAHLENLRTPTLILQGERDRFGLPEEVEGYTLAKKVRVHWLPDGDHSLAPRKKSGLTLDQNLDEAAQAAADFVLSAASRRGRLRS